MAASAFSERDFYLAEFRGRTLAIAIPAAAPEDLPQLDLVLAELRANRTRVLLVSQDLPLLEKLAPGRVVSSSESDWLAALWRQLGGETVGGVAVPATRELESECRRIVQRIRPAKLVWIDPAGPLRTPAGDRISLVDMRGLAALLADAEGPATPQLDGPLSAQRRRLLLEIQTLVGDQLPAVNLCSAGGLADDLFTFEGSGTFFARERYLHTRHLSLDEFAAAQGLIERGVSDGYLVERSPTEIAGILANAFGVFVENRYLAGIGALVRHAAAAGGGVGEIVSLYTLTRFLGEGVGAHLVSFAVEQAQREGLPYVFACTTSERVEAFFLRQGFERVGPEEIPAAKWRDYPDERRARVRCVRRAVEG